MSVDRPTFQPDSDPATPEARLAGVISEIRTSYAGVPYRSPRTQALTDIDLLLGLARVASEGNADVTGIQNAIIARKKDDSREYAEALDRLDGLTASAIRGFGDPNRQVVGLRDLSQRLSGIVTELYPQHRQR